MIIIKIGGGKSVNISKIIADVKNLQEPFVIIHGGNYILDELTEKFGIKKQYYTSPNGQISRATDQKIVDLMYMGYAGYMNKSIVAACQKAGINAIGLSGIDGKLITGKQHETIITIENGKKKVVRNDLTGSVEKINTGLLNILLANSFVPVITPPVITDTGEIINTDGDKIATKIALALQATTMLFLIEASGMLTDFPDEKSLVTTIKANEIENFLPAAQGRMKKKLMMSKVMLQQGVKKIIIADGRGEHPVLDALKKGKGTTLS